MPSTDFNTADPLALTRSLSDLLIAVIADDSELGGQSTADRLRTLRDAIWPAAGTRNGDPQETFKQVLSNLNTDEENQLMEAYARMGHLYDIASLAAREHYFTSLQDKPSPTPRPGGVLEFASKQNNVNEAIERFSHPVFEVVLTQHPTNTNSLESVKAQRQLALALEHKDEGKMREAMKHFMQTPLLPNKDGKDQNFTVRDETANVVNALENIYADLPHAYAQFDYALNNKFPKDYDPLKLNLNIRLGSWGSSGDKDGNNSVTAETTLEGLTMHTQSILKCYLGSLEKFKLAGNAPLAPLQKWHHDISQTLTTLEPLMGEISALVEDSNAARKEGKVDNTLCTRFDKLSHQLAAIRQGLNANAFEKDLRDLYPKLSDKEQHAVLNLARRVHLFGFNLAKIEYRETAVEYSRVVGELINGYNDLTPEARARKLEELLQEPGNKALELFEKKKNDIRAAAANAYDEKNALPIAYHTVKRMELARDFPDMIKDNVLAECGQLNEGAPDHDIIMQGKANMLEALFLQRAAEKDGRKPLLGIVPLFEEPDTMKNITEILGSTYDSPAYKAHMQALADERHEGKLTQQVQIAHSDNSRRSGLMAARAAIHLAHKKVSKFNEERGIQTQFFEGGSISDTYRNGVRAISAAVDEFGLYDFAKFTFQGGDLVNYFNIPSSIARLFTRNIAHAAKAENREKWARDNPFDDIVIPAMLRTQNDYRLKDFTTEAMGNMLAVLDYWGEIKAGNRGSRAGQRKAVVFANVESVQQGARHVPVPADKIRTIGFSEAWQHMGIMPAYIGAQKIEDYLKDEIIKMRPNIDDPKYSDRDRETFKAIFGGATLDQPLSPTQLYTLSTRSPTFKDGVDRVAFGSAWSNPKSFELIENRAQKLESMPREQSLTYLDRLLSTSIQAGRLAYSALTKKALGARQAAHLHMGDDALPRLAPTIRDKCNYRDFVIYAKEQGGLDDHERGLAHNAIDTTSHCRYLPADDPAYGASYFADKERQRASTKEI